MAKITTKSTLDINITFSINESEARALEALSGYGDDAFIKQFYDYLGENYLKPHEQGLREFLKTIRTVLTPELGRIDEARKFLATPKNG